MLSSEQHAMNTHIDSVDSDDFEELQRREEEQLGLLDDSLDLFRPGNKDYDSGSDSDTVRSQSLNLRNRTVEPLGSKTMDASSSSRSNNGKGTAQRNKKNGKLSKGKLNEIIHGVSFVS